MLCSDSITNVLRFLQSIKYEISKICRYIVHSFQTQFEIIIKLLLQNISKKIRLIADLKMCSILDSEEIRTLLRFQKYIFPLPNTV